MIEVAGLSHLTIHVTDLDRSEAFYRDVMGLEPLGRDLVEDDGPTSLLRAETGHLLVLVEVDEVEPIRGQNTAVHHAWYLTPEQHARAIARMEAQGYDTKDARATFRAMGEKSFDIVDPDGHRYQVQAVGPEATEILKPGLGKVRCGSMEDFERGSTTLFNEGKFYLVRNAEGFMALSRWCSHMNGLVQWKSNHWQFVCPYHKATFDRRGAPTSRSACLSGLAPLRLHPIEIAEDGSVIVDTDVVLVREAVAPEDVTPPTAKARTRDAHLSLV